MMIAINYPPPEFRIKEEKEGKFLFDTIRKKWIVLTPEEWVRQNFIQYLLKIKQYPESLIAIEKEIKLGELRKRFDMLVYNRQHQPWMLIECKAMDVALTEAALSQVLRYQLSVPVSYFVITNGNCTYAWQLQKREAIILDNFPDFET